MERIWVKTIVVESMSTTGDMAVLGQETPPLSFG